MCSCLTFAPLLYSRNFVLMARRFLLIFLIILASDRMYGTKLFIPMDATQANHLKAYGIVYNALASGTRAGWLLNYKGGSFVMEYTAAFDTLCMRKGVTFKRMPDKDYQAIVKKIKAPDFNGDVVALDKAPRVAVYTPANKKPWDDAVTRALTYAEIPFDKIYVKDVLDGSLKKYDWLHLHHEDFTGQFGKFWTLFGDVDWYKYDVAIAQRMAKAHGYSKVSQMQLAVAKKIKEFVGSGGKLFAMCSATDSYDIALAANDVDICDSPFDGDGMDPRAQQKLDYNQCFAFKGFKLSTDRNEYRIGDIDNTAAHEAYSDTDFFMLNTFPAKFDPVPAMLCQDHTQRIKGFLGLATAYKKERLKPDVLVLGGRTDINEAKYIHGQYQAGTWTFYGGHDPEDYRHTVGSMPTDLNNFPNSPGYRLILNNVLSPASDKKDVEAVVVNTVAAPVLESTAQMPITPTSDVKITAGSSANTLNITITGADNSRKIEKVALVNAAGKEVVVRQFSSSQVTVDLENIPAGLYSIKVNGEYAGKVVKR